MTTNMIRNVALGVGLALVFGTAPAALQAAAVDEIAGLKLWLQADGSLTKDVNNRVSIWNDTTDGSNNTTAQHAERLPANGVTDVTGYQPLYTENAFGTGLAGIYFDGIDDYLSISPPISETATTLTLSAVIRTTDTSGGILSWYGNHNYYGYSLAVRDGGKPTFDAVSGTEDRVDVGGTQGDDAVNNDAAYILTAVYDGSFKKLYVNGTLVASEAQQGANGGYYAAHNSLGVTAYDVDGNEPQPAVVDKYKDAPLNDTVTGWFQGYMGEIIAYESALSDAERGDVESYLATKYNIPIPEPASAFFIASGGLLLMLRRR